MFAHDPRANKGPFSKLYDEIKACKTAKTCPALRTRQFYFEPNKFTALSWKDNALFTGRINYRVMFVCESPGPSAMEGKANDIEPCFYFSSRDHRFQEARSKYGLGSCYITNTVKCGVRRGTQHTMSEVEKCRRFLLREIDLIDPQVIVGVGGNAYRTLRKEVLGQMKNPPILYQITHYSSRRNPRKSWDKEFPDLNRLLATLRPPKRRLK